MSLGTKSGLGMAVATIAPEMTCRAPRIAEPAMLYASAAPCMSLNDRTPHGMPLGDGALGGTPLSDRAWQKDPAVEEPTAV